MKADQNYLEHLRDQVDIGKMPAEEANVAKVRAARVFLVVSRIPREVKKALGVAVKKGELCHLKKDGQKPETYYHPDFEYLVAGERNEHERRILRALSLVCV